MGCCYCLHLTKHDEIAHDACGSEWQRRICANVCVKCAEPSGGAVTCFGCRTADSAPWIGYPPDGAVS